MLTSKVAAEVQAMPVHVEADVCGAKNVARGMESGPEAARDLDVALERVPLELPETYLGILFGVEREWLLVLRKALARSVLRVFFK
jgi:hypothetical protein